MSATTPIAVAVFASGGGSNLQALIDHFRGGAEPAARIALVVSDRPDTGALERAGKAGIPAEVVSMKSADRDDAGPRLLGLLERHAIGIVALAGFLKLVPDGVVRRYRGRIVNIHPALLPAFGGPGYYGLRVHRAVLASGAAVTGPTVHLVDEEYDSGRILAQWPVPVLPDDTAESLAARVLEVEHALYPVVIEALARGQPVEYDGLNAAPVSASAPTIEDVRAALGLQSPTSADR